MPKSQIVKCEHDWQKSEELIRRDLTPEQEKKLARYNAMFPKAAEKVSLAAVATWKICSKCKKKSIVNYEVN